LWYKKSCVILADKSDFHWKLKVRNQDKRGM